MYGLYGGGLFSGGLYGGGLYTPGVVAPVSPPGDPEEFFRTLTGQDRRTLSPVSSNRTFGHLSSAGRVWQWRNDMARKTLTLELWAGESKTFGFDYSAEGSVRDGDVILSDPPPTVTVNPSTGLTVGVPEVLEKDFSDSDGKKVGAGKGFKVRITAAANLAALVTIVGSAYTTTQDFLKVKGKLNIE